MNPAGSRVGPGSVLRRPLAGGSRATPLGSGTRRSYRPGARGRQRPPRSGHSGRRDAWAEAAGRAAGVPVRAAAHQPPRLCSARPSAAAFQWLRPRPNFQATVSRRQRGQGGLCPTPRAPAKPRLRFGGSRACLWLRHAPRAGPQRQEDGLQGLPGRWHPGWATSPRQSVPTSVNRG